MPSFDNVSGCHLCPVTACLSRGNPSALRHVLGTTRKGRLVIYPYIFLISSVTKVMIIVQTIMMITKPREH